MKSPHRHRFVLYHALTVGLGIVFTAGLLALAGFVGPVRSVQAQQATPTPVQSTLTSGSCGQQGTLPSQVRKAHCPMARSI
jgi:hypothetical protein